MIDPLVIPLAALVIPIIAIPTSLAFKHAAKLRDLDHLERMRALELGRLDPKDTSRSSTLKVGGWLAIGVPLIVMLAAAQATIESGFHAEIWIASGFVCTAAVVCGSILVARFRPAEARPPAEAKPAFDADAFEFAGRG